MNLKRTDSGPLAEIYRRHAEASRPFTSEAACARGCAYCCTAAGSIDATTQEGLAIQAYLQQLPRTRQKAIEKRLRREMGQRERGRVVACPFLQKNRTCQIYPVRPFSCRRVYSLHVCTAQAPPQVHRQAMALAATAIDALRAGDPNGYSGHLSYILHMLAQPRFREIYLAGGFAPEAVMAFGKTHNISINRTTPAAGDAGQREVER